MSMQQDRDNKNRFDALEAMLGALAAQIDRMEKKYEELEQRRGPGRPRTIPEEQRA
jgi:hypothetical protein